jgi:hypothetical protein
MFSGFFNRHGNDTSISPQLIETLIQNALQQNMEESSGLTPTMLRNLRENAQIVETTNENLNQCSVCLENINVGESCVTLECNHKFHVQCIERWCERHNTCPVCRHQIEEPQQNVQRTQRIIVNNISTVHMTVNYEGNVYNTYWNSCNTLVDIFIYFSRFNETSQCRFMLQIGNKIYKTTESYELLAHTLSQHGIVGHVNANLYNC